MAVDIMNKEGTTRINDFDKGKIVVELLVHWLILALVVFDAL